MIKLLLNSYKKAQKQNKIVTLEAELTFDGKATALTFLRVIYPSSIVPTTGITIQGKVDIGTSGDGGLQIDQTNITLTKDVMAFWGYSPEKIIWRCNGKSNILHRLFTTPDGELITFRNDMFTYPNIGSTSDEFTKYIIELYPADYEDSGTYTMRVGKGEFIDIATARAPERGMNTGYYKNSFGEFYTNKIFDCEIYAFYNYYSISTSLIRLGLKNLHQKTLDIPQSLRITLDGNLHSGIFTRIQNDGLNAEFELEDATIAAYIRDNTNNSILVAIEPL